MKQLLILLMLVVLFGCQPKPPKAVITGNINEPIKDFVILYADNYSDTAFLDSTGSFSMEVFLEENGKRKRYGLDTAYQRRRLEYKDH